MNPTIDSSTERFKWGNPDFSSIRKYTRFKFGWDESKCDSVLKPILKNFETQVKEISRQPTLDGFVTFGKPSAFQLLSGTKRKIKSRRLIRAMKKLKRGVGSAPSELNLSSDSKSDSDSDSETESPKSKPASKKKRRLLGLAPNSESDGEKIKDIPKKKSIRGKKASVEKKSKLEAGTARIPKKVTDIPVLQKTMEESERKLNKLKAIEVLKNKKGK